MNTVVATCHAPTASDDNISSLIADVIELVREAGPPEDTWSRPVIVVDRELYTKVWNRIMGE